MIYVPAILSASCWIGALDVCASSINLTIWESVVSLPTCVAVIIIIPFWLIDPPINNDPFCFKTGIDSPVINDSSIIDTPSMTRPSTGILPPGTTLRWSSLWTSSTDICFSLIIWLFLSNWINVASVAWKIAKFGSSSKVCYRILDKLGPNLGLMRD